MINKNVNAEGAMFKSIGDFLLSHGIPGVQGMIQLLFLKRKCMVIFNYV